MDSPPLLSCFMGVFLLADLRETHRFRGPFVCLGGGGRGGNVMNLRPKDWRAGKRGKAERGEALGL